MEDSKPDGDDYAAKLLKGVEGEGQEGDNQNKISNKDLAYVFLQTRDNFPAKPYYEDGNPEMYTSENMQARQELKKKDMVIEAI